MPLFQGPELEVMEVDRHQYSRHHSNQLLGVPSPFLRKFATTQPTIWGEHLWHNANVDTLSGLLTTPGYPIC